MILQYVGTVSAVTCDEALVSTSPTGVVVSSTACGAFTILSKCMCSVLILASVSYSTVSTLSFMHQP